MSSTKNIASKENNISRNNNINISTSYVSKVYKLYLLGASILHGIFSILFFIASLYQLTVYNIFSTVLYAICLKYFKVKRMQKIFIIINIELLLFIIAAILCVGSQYNFSLYSYLLIPLCILSSISRKNNTYNLKHAILQFIPFSILILLARLYVVLYPVNFKPEKSISILFDIISTCNYIIVALVSFIVLCAFVADINSSSKRLEAINNELTHIATHDPLTGLINRRSMNDQFFAAIENYKKNHQCFSLILADIDDFKKVNDIYGHDSGDIVLKRVSKIISDIVKEPGAVCRWGGEEILILTYHNLQGAVDVAEQIRTSIQKTSFLFNNTYIKATLTLGVAEYKPDLPISKIVTIADTNLYKGKKSTKNCVVA